MAYWRVDDVDVVMARPLDLGAAPHEPPRDHGPFRAGAVRDPCGDVLGVLAGRG
ncbi:hypothetical protein GCM10009639_37940 [Kitasatospora putterlickiae]|uniref:Uncharacterized protein n=1 Tax=Kitasatospora putterlickiae TaxID=221725 RepID=A0ABN1Y615_9ACTN